MSEHTRPQVHPRNGRALVLPEEIDDVYPPSCTWRPWHRYLLNEDWLQLVRDNDAQIYGLVKKE